MRKIDKDCGYVVGVSGGPDSIYLLTELVKKKFKNIVVAHVNYNYRNDSLIDQQIVEKMAAENNLPVRILNIDPKIYQQQIGNFEAWARTTRYDFFQSVADEFGFKQVLIAHNQNDHIETFIFQKERNNLVAHFGLSSKTEQGKLIIKRPLLGIKKSTILKNLNTSHIPYQIDSTNADQKFARNRIRAKLKEDDFPKYNLEIKNANQNLKKEIKATKEYLKKYQTSENLALAKTWKTLSQPIKSRIIYEFFQSFEPKIVQNRKRKLVQEVLRRLENSQKNFWMIPIDDFYIFKDYQNLRLVVKNRISPKKFIIKNKNDLYLTEEFVNGPNLLALIKKDQEHFPYVVTNNYELIKDKLTIKNKSIKSVYNSQKTPYLCRFEDGLVYRKATTEVLI